MTDIDRAAIRARAEAATDGPWYQGGRYDGEWRSMGRGSGGVIIGNDGHILVAPPEYNYADAEFIAHARTDIPALLAALEAAERRVGLLARQLQASALDDTDGLRKVAVAETRPEGAERERDADAAVIEQVRAVSQRARLSAVSGNPIADGNALRSILERERTDALETANAEVAISAGSAPDLRHRMSADTPTRGLTVAVYTRAFNAGYNSHSIFEEDDLDVRLGRYLARGVKTDAHEHAWLDGNTFGDDGATQHLTARAQELDGAADGR